MLFGIFNSNFTVVMLGIPIKQGQITKTQAESMQEN